jgi:biopolymer transport protein ExbD
MRRTRFKPEIKKNQSFSLNITSMTDMFTIMLVFLLQSFASGEVQVDPSKGLNLPTSNTEKNLVRGVQVAMSGTELKVEQKVVARLKNENFENGTIDSSDSHFIKPLFTELQAINELQKKKNSKDVPGTLLLSVDRDLPYGLIRKVMYTASMAGFPQLKLVTTLGNN